ncbi:MAG: methyl-accepting chemotaxis protein [Lachnospiraceae bacterium]|nr:methyl-accepting chemotaxis protein [Lachnospiraceae bacterium]
MKFKKISTRLLIVILPVIILAMVALSVFGATTSKQIIDQKTSESMTTSLEKSVSQVMEQIESVERTGIVISDTVAANYKKTDLETYEQMLTNIVSHNDIVLGSGLWFEPYVYDEKEEYMGPYVYKDGDKITTTYEYSNKEYDYFVQEYYTVAKESTTPVITNPYYDPTSGLIMSTCSVPIIVDGTYIGCVSVDMELSTVTSLVSDIKVGTNGSAMLLDTNGVYLAGVSDEKIASEANIADETNASLAAAGSVVMGSENGETSFKDNGKKINLYFTTLPKTNWKLAIQMPESEIIAPVQRLIILLVIVCIIATVISVLIILLQISNIAKKIKRVEAFAISLANGDFSVDPLDISSEDEIGKMGESLNAMYNNNKDIIYSLSIQASEITDSGRKLRSSSGMLHEKFNEILSYMNTVNEAMTNNSAATEEINASTEEVLSNVNLLTSEANKNSDFSKEIKGKTAKISADCRESSASASQLAKQFEENLQSSIADAVVVANISEMAEVISSIAEQINLLSLNASIEAARAGDAGKGFAVVATEIGKLAENTTDAIKKIQDTIEHVQRAFKSLTDEAQKMLDFLQNTVTPDYNNFVDIASQYGDDASYFESSSEKISNMSNNICTIMGEVTTAIQSVAEATQDTSETSHNILDAIKEVTEQVEDVDNMSAKQEDISTGLHDVVNKFDF